MTQFDSIIEAIQKEDYNNKIQLLSYTHRMLQGILSAKKSLAEEDKQTLLTFAFEELPALCRTILLTKETEERDQLTTYADGLVHLVTVICPTPEELSAEHLELMRHAMALIEKEQELELTLERLLEGPQITAEEMRKLFSLADQDPDGYRRAKLYEGLLHYEQKLSILSPEAKGYMAAQLADDFRRYLTATPDRIALHTLELGADLARHFATKELSDLLAEITLRGWPAVNCYAVRSLLASGHEIPDSVLVALAKDLEHAQLAYTFLKDAGKEALFPPEYRTPEYLAKSDMVHWLCYPTELGKAPDEIEYLGQSKKLFQKEIYYIFKFRSNSDTLSEDLRGKWLIGWSNDDGGTFSNFDEYATYEKPTLKATLKNIQKHLIG